MLNLKNIRNTLLLIICPLFCYSQFIYSTNDEVRYFIESSNESTPIFNNLSPLGPYTFDYSNQGLIVNGKDMLNHHDWNGAPNYDLENIPEVTFSFSQHELVHLPETNYVYGITNSGIARIKSIFDPNDFQTTIVTGSVGGLAIDKGINKIFYTDKNTNKVMKCDLDGSNLEEIYYLASALTVLDDIEVDEDNQTIYWTNQGQGRIQSCDYSGNNFENIVTNLTSPTSLCLHNKHLYWFDNNNNRILQHSLTSGSTSSLLESFNGGENLQANIETEELFWIYENSIMKMKITSQSIVSVLSTFATPNNGISSIAIDPIDNKIFATSYLGLIELNIDGSNSAALSNGDQNFSNSRIAIDPISELIFVDDDSAIATRPFDENNWTSFSSPNGFAFNDLQIDISNQKIYFAFNNNIYKINYDGSNEEIVFESEASGNIQSYFIDEISGKIFFSINDLVYKSNTDGSQQEPIISGNISQIISDPINNRLYYLKNNGVYHTDLDGYFETQFIAGLINQFLSIDINSFNLLPLIIVEANATGSDVTIEWTMDENFSGFVNNSVAIGNFFIERKTMTEDWTDIGTLSYFEGVSTYSYTDDAPEFGLNSYRLRYISDNGGLTSYSKNFEVDYLVGVETELPDYLKLWYAHLDKEIKTEGFTGQLNIYNQLGQLQLSQEVNTDISQHNVLHLESGIHFAEIITTSGIKYAKSFLLMK